MLTEGEPPEKAARLSSPPPLPPDTTGHDAHSHPSDGEQGGAVPDMPAFPERGGPPPLTTASMSMQEHRLSMDQDMSSESPEGSNLSGSEGGKYGGGEKGFSRKQREFIPENRKDELYWEKRRKNNEVKVTQT